MFTGLIQETGTVTATQKTNTGTRIQIASPTIAATTDHGASICVSGTCLTVTNKNTQQTQNTFTADIIPETLARTTLGNLQPGNTVNLEASCTPNTLLGGHIVQGHVDATTRLNSHTPDHVLRFTLPNNLKHLVCEKGSITVDGVSLTVSAVSPPQHTNPWFEVSLIPETLARTTLGNLQPGETANLETDIIARHIERLLATQNPQNTKKL